jgi:hypothetical protein
MHGDQTLWCQSRALIEQCNKPLGQQVTALLKDTSCALNSCKLVRGCCLLPAVRGCCLLPAGRGFCLLPAAPCWAIGSPRVV